MATLRLLFVALGVLALAATPVRAGQGPTAGLVVGASLGGVGLRGTGAVGIDPGVKAGVTAGGYGVFPLTPKIALQSEALYSRKRFALKDAGRQFDTTDRWDWIEVPVLVRVSFKGRSDGLYVTGGPGFSYLVRAREQEGGRTFDITGAVRRVDVSVIGGIGYAAGRLGVETRFDAGMRDLNKSLGSEMTIRNRGIRMTVTWRP